MIDLFGDANWQTVALFVIIFLCAAWYLARANNNPQHANFHLLDLIADEGKLNRREIRATGVWLICTAIVVVTTINGSVSWEWMVAYATLFYLEKGIDVYKSTAIRRAEIIRGRAEDVDIDTGRTAEEMTVEEQEAAYKGKERRKKRLLG